MASATRKIRWLLTRSWSEWFESVDAEEPTSSGWETDAIAVDDDWPTRVQRHPQLEIVGELGNAETVDLTLESMALRGWAQRMTFEVIDGRVELVGVEQRRRPPIRGHWPNYDAEGNPERDPDGNPVQGRMVDDIVYRKPLTTRLLRGMGLGELLDPARELLADDVIRRRFLGPAWSKPPVRPGGSQRSDHFRALWANRYVWALAHDARRPIAYIESADQSAGLYRSTGEVRNQVDAARPTYLTRSEKRGKAGGSLTDLSINLLAQLGVMPGDDVPVTE